MKIKHFHLGGGGPKMKRSLANCKIAPKTGPSGHTQNGCHMDALCIGQTGLSVLESSLALCQLSFGDPKGPKRKLAVVPPYKRGELFRCQPSVCAPATEVATGPFFCSLFWGRPRFELQG